MEKFTINNFRLFDNNFEFETPPITVLTGKNNSGKSSFIKALLLFDDYLSSQNQLLIDFNGNRLSKHKINSFDNAKNWYKGKYFSFTQNLNGIIECTYQFKKHESTGASLKMFHLNVLNSKLFIKFEYNKTSEGDYKIFYSKDIIQYAVLLEKIKIIENKINLHEFKINRLIADPSLEEKDGVKLSSDITYERQNKLNKELEILNKNKEETERDINLLLQNGGKIKYDVIIDTNQNKRRFINKSLLDLVANNIITDFGNRSSEEKKDISISSNLKYQKKATTNSLPDFYFPVYSLFFEINDIIIHHLSPNRTRQERMYMNKLEDTEIETEISKFEKTPVVTEFMNEWLETFKIGDDINIINFEGIASMLTITEKQKKVNLVDMGFGTGQILTILLKISNTINEIVNKRGERRHKSKVSHIIIIEEPESNLHPALQSYLAFLFIEVYKKYGIRFVIETHSEYFIRNLQLLVAEEHFGFNKNEAIIYYMSNTKNEKRINKITINDDGSLSDKFGEGFLDEATRKALKLMELKNKRRKI